MKEKKAILVVTVIDEEDGLGTFRLETDEIGKPSAKVIQTRDLILSSLEKAIKHILEIPPGQKNN